MQVLSEVSEKQLIRLQIPVEQAEDKTLIQSTLKRKTAQFILKRTFDIVVASALILLLSPVLLLIAALIKLSSNGKILYTHELVGYKGRNFRCYKFRSMVADHPTWIGKIMRRSSIDDLPQLFNVLQGNMSLVGPRPLEPSLLAHLPEFKAVRCLVRPGITGLWQLRDRVNNMGAESMIAHDTEYIKDYSLLMDIKILISTPMVVLSGQGAY